MLEEENVSWISSGVGQYRLRTAAYAAPDDR
jgi:hypothetical protein